MILNPDCASESLVHLGKRSKPTGVGVGLGSGLYSKAPGDAGGSQASDAENKAAHVGRVPGAILTPGNLSLPGQHESLAKGCRDPYNQSISWLITAPAPRL